ncbi:MAG TPA: PucR family transcriptional regulator ligand-binding domain-containing protein, partial [Anaerovoracaceae bacterium]|nr:PucR family transcriptional regulator ligand-binding domain-containing protein [Anaerovoracaceae bacterium]
MLTVMELLSFPLFRNFKLASGYGGLYNQVSGTGIFEWESSYDVEKNFEPGEFIVTTLSLSRSDTVLAESSIRMLIDKKVSAIAIKDIYYHEISEELKVYSDAHQVPVFFFSETFFDDIIYTIKNTLLSH